MADGGDTAMQNFTMNTLRGMGTGGSTGPGSGISSALLPDSEQKVEAIPQKFAPLDGISYWATKLMGATQGFAQSVSLNNLFSGISPPPTPIGAGAKIANIMGRK